MNPRITEVEREAVRPKSDTTVPVDQTEPVVESTGSDDYRKIADEKKKALLKEIESLKEKIRA